MTKTLQTREISFLEFTDEEMEELHMKKGDKFSMDVLEDGSIKLTPYVDIEIDFDSMNRETLIHIIEQSNQRGETVEEYIEYILTEMIKNTEEDQLQFGF